MAALQTDLDSMENDLTMDEQACYQDGCCWAQTQAPGPNVEVASCAWRYFEAFVGIAWGASGIAGAVAVTVSPEPVSKTLIFAAYSNAVAGVGASILGVRAAWNCHYYQIYAPICWIDPRAGRGVAGLDAVTALG